MLIRTQKQFLSFLIIFSCFIQTQKASGIEVTLLTDEAKNLPTYEKIIKPAAKLVATFIGLTAFLTCADMYINSYPLSKAVSENAQQVALIYISQTVLTIAHELGHVTATKLSRLQVTHPFLSIMPTKGGCARINAGHETSPLKILFISLAGPLAGIGGAIAWYSLGTHYLMNTTLDHKYILLSNVINNLINLIPFQGSDGYQAYNAMRELLNTKKNTTYENKRTNNELENSEAIIAEQE